MAGPNVKIGVSGVSQFKQDINQAKEAVKTFDAQLALCEKRFKSTGDEEAYLAEKAALLKGKMDAQKASVESMEKALEAMRKNGVSTSSSAYQNLYRQMLKAKGEMIDTAAEAEKLGASEQEAGKQANGLKEKLKGIGKGVGWENVTSGIKEITDKLEQGARAAVNFAKKVARSAMDSTGWADDLLTRATQYGIDAETLQAMENVADLIDTDVDAILSAKSRLAKNGGSLSEVLGIETEGKTVDEAFWEAGRAIMAMTDEFEKEEAAQKIFGRGWKELVPLFTAGEEAYNRLLEEQNVLSNEQVQKLGQADDAIKSIQQQIELMKSQFWADNADKIMALGQWILDNKGGLVSAIEAIAVAFGALKLGEVALNVGKIVNGFKLLSGGGEGGGTGGGGSPTVAPTGGGGSGLGWGGMLGVAGLSAIVSGFAKAGYMRNFQSEQVRGTDANLAAQSAGAEVLLAQYLNAEKARANFDWMSATEAEAAEIQAQVEATRQKLMEAEGGADALQAYSDWRQEHSYGSDYWELPDTLAQAVQDLTGGTDRQAQSNSEMAQAAKGLQGLPAAMANAVIGAMSGISVTIDGGVLAGWLNTNQATMVLNH